MTHPLRRRQALAYALAALEVSRVNAETLVPPQSAEGRFDVKIGAPQALAQPDGGATLYRRSLDKQYQGALQGHALGEMLAGGNPAGGSAGYVAIESFSGSLQGRQGGFALMQLGLMDAGKQEMHYLIVPGSGLDGLAGITGELKLRIEGGVHAYSISYRLPG